MKTPIGRRLLIVQTVGLHVVIPCGLRAFPNLVWEILVWEILLSVLWSVWCLTESCSQSGGSWLLSAMTFWFRKGRGFDFRLIAGGYPRDWCFFLEFVCLWLLPHHLFVWVKLSALSWGFRRTTVDPTPPRAARNPQIAASQSSPYPMEQVRLCSEIGRTMALWVSPPAHWGSFEWESVKTKARWVCPPARWGRFVCESGRTMALWLCPPARWGRFVFQISRPFGCNPLPDGAGSFVQVENA